MAGNETEHGRRGRDFSSRERDSKLSPSPSAVAGRERTAHPSASHHHRPRSTSAHRARDPNRDRPALYHHRHHHHQHHRHHDSSRAQPPLSSAADEAAVPSLSTRRPSPSPAPSTSSRYANRPSRDYSPRPPSSYAQRPYPDRPPPARRPHSPDPYPPRRRSRSVESRYSSRQPRYPSGRDRYNDRRRYSPPPNRDYRPSGSSSRGRPDSNYASRHSKPSTRSPPRDPRRSDSPSDDLISQLASTARPEEAKSSRRRGPSAHSRRSSRSPRPDTRRPYRRDSSRYRERERERDRDRGYGREYDREYARSRDFGRGGRRDYNDRRDRYRDEREPDTMYGRGGPPRQPMPPRSYVDPRYSQSPQYPPPGLSPPYAQSPYGRAYPPQSAYASYQGSPAHAAYSSAASPYHQQAYPPPAASPYYQAPQHQQPPPPHYAAPPPMSAYPHQSSYRGQPHSRGYNGSQRPPGAAPAPAAPVSRGGRGGHFSNLSWTPSSGSRGGKVVSKRETSMSGTETPLAAGSTTGSVDDDDNPFRPPKDLRAEDETEKRKSGISFSIKGMAGRADPFAPQNHKPASAAEPRTRKEIVVRKRLKPKPKLTTEFAASDSVYYRKTGNESVVGSGTYGKVYKAVHVYTGDKVALKKIRMEGERDGFPVTAIREIKLLQSLNHTNVVKLQEVMVERNDCFMIFEYLSHDLTGLLNHPSFVLTEAHKKDLARQLFEGLDYLHKRGVLHRDIKAANILVSRNGELKLADFGLARFYNKNAKRKQDYTNRVITIWYRSPELLLGETQYGPAVDIWSAACVLVEIFTKHAIFPGDGGEINQLDKIYNVLGTPSRSNWAGIVDLAWYELLRPMHKVPSTFAEKYQDRVSPAAFALLSAMFVFDPDTRPSASDVLEHAYFVTEKPKAEKVVELANLEGDWHEFESKALRKEKEREARRRDKENAEKRKPEGSAGEERDQKRAKTGGAEA